jgi:holo-ACP synthase
LLERDLPAGAREAVQAASLAQVLSARDRRAARQRELLAHHGWPVLSLTLVSPGPVKDSPGRRLLMDLMEDALRDELHRARLLVRQQVRMDGVAGPEALWVAEAPARRLKQLAVALEDSRPWGRLLDVDVVFAGVHGEPLPMGRHVLGCEPRRCLLCESRAKECIGARRHHPAAAAAMVAALVGRFTGLP